jgi:hypothetical protein
VVSVMKSRVIPLRLDSARWSNRVSLLIKFINLVDGSLDARSFSQDR